MNYECKRLIILTVDASPIRIGWTIKQDDQYENRCVIRFRAKILNIRQRTYIQIKKII